MTQGEKCLKGKQNTQGKDTLAIISGFCSSEDGVSFAAGAEEPVGPKGEQCYNSARDYVHFQGDV